MNKGQGLAQDQRRAALTSLSPEGAAVAGFGVGVTFAESL
jgi:hypothetical protein